MISLADFMKSLYHFLLYYRLKVLSKFTFGKRRAVYKRKYKIFKLQSTRRPILKRIYLFVFRSLIKNKFDSKFYTSFYSDVSTAEGDAWKHFCEKGFYEKRFISLEDKLYRNRKARYSRFNLYNRLVTFFYLLKNKDCNVRIAIILHLFYMQSWYEIYSLISRLNRFNAKFYITYISEYSNQQILNAIKKALPDVELVPYENKGYDVGPFIDLIRNIDLEEYDIVYKIHSKGVSRPLIYIYKQLFKYRDWFENLYHGLFTPTAINKCISLLTGSENIGLVAANNLIVEDPEHKKWFTKRAASKLGISLPEPYFFVAGSCFAIRSKLLRPIQNLKLSINDFEQTVRGEFSLAHAMERLVCAEVLSQGYDMYGIEVKYPLYKKELQYYQSTDAIQILQNQNFLVDYDFFYKVLEMQRIKRFEVVTLELKDIRRKWHDGKLYKLSECSPYLYLQTGDEDMYNKYCEKNMKLSHGTQFSTTLDRYKQLITSVRSGYNEKYIPIVNQQNILMDGQHRCCILMHLYGEKHRIKVLKLHI